MSDWELYSESDDARKDFFDDAYEGFNSDEDAQELFLKWLDLSSAKICFELWKQDMADEAFLRNFGAEDD